MAQAPHHLRPETTSFVGRARELEWVFATLAQGVRVVTVTGPAGIGKSRLAAHYAWTAEARARWQGGIWRFDLSEATTTSDILGVLARSLRLDPQPTAAALGGVDEAGDVQAVGLIGAALERRGETLLICDEVDHLIDRLRPIVSTLAEYAAVLICTRERLGLDREWCLALGPLGLLAEDAQSACEAVELLLERGRAAGFEPERSGSNGDHRQRPLVELARKLDGNPLALEHAAARLGLMAPCQLLERLDQRLDLLTSRTHPSASLRAAIARSWVLLSTAERTVFAQLTIFGGPFELAAAEYVATIDPCVSTLDVLDALVRKSLVHVVATPQPARPARSSGRVLDIYDSLRTFGREQLVADHATFSATASRHAELALARAVALASVAPTSDLQLEPGPVCASSFQPEASELADLLAAVAWALHPVLLSGASVERALTLLIALQPALRARGHLERVASLFESALSHAHLIPSSAATRARTALAEALYLHGRGGEATQLLEKGLASAREGGDLLSEAMLVGALGASHFYGRADVSLEDLERACHALEQGDQCEAALDARMRLARAHENEGRVELAITCYREVLALARAAGQRRRVALAELNLGALHAHLGGDASGHYRAALAWSRELADPLLEAVTLANLGIAAFERCDDEDARFFFLEAARVESRLGFGRVQAIAQGHLALLSHVAGDYEQARACYRAALAAWEHAWPDALTWSLLMLGLAMLAANAGEVAEAQRLLGKLELVHGERHGLAEQALIELTKHAVSHRGQPEPAFAAKTLRLAGPALSALARRPRRGTHQLRAALRLFGALPSAIPTAVLAVARGGHRFVTPEGRSVELGRRGPARRILAELASTAASGAGVSLELERLFEVAWPGENVRPPYRANRVYVVIADLRKLGLEGLLINDGDGYRLDPATPVVLLDA